MGIGDRSVEWSKDTESGERLSSGTNCALFNTQYFTIFHKHVLTFFNMTNFSKLCE
jgi:hypothetical protein